MSTPRRRTQTLHNAILTEHYEQVQDDLTALDVSLTALDAAFGAYYTPAAIVPARRP